MRQYRTARSNTVTMLRDAKKAFFNELNTADKKFWKTMKYLRKEQIQSQCCLIMAPLHTITMTRQTSSVVSFLGASIQATPSNSL